MANKLIKVSQEQWASIVELNLPDGLDSSEFDLLIEKLSSIFDESAVSSKWVIDLAAVDYLGSSALGLLVNIRQKVKSAQGKLALCNLSVRLQQIFHTCCLEKLFIISRTREEAMRAVL